MSTTLRSTVMMTTLRSTALWSTMMARPLRFAALRSAMMMARSLRSAALRSALGVMAFAFGAAALGAVVMAVPFVIVAGAALVGAFVAVAAVVALGLLFTASFHGFFDVLSDGSANVVAGGAVLAARGSPLMGAFLYGAFACLACFFDALFPSFAGLFARRGAFLGFT